MLILNFNPFPVLFTPRLMLRQILEDDVNEIFVLRSNKEVMQFIGRPLATSAEDALELIKKITDGINNNEGITWAISLQNNTELIGTIGFWKIDKENYRAEIGYLLHPAHQQKGIMQEAVAASLSYGFSAIKIHSVEANIDPANMASKKLLEKNGFVQEAYFKENFYYNGQFLDSAIYSLLAPLK